MQQLARMLTLLTLLTMLILMCTMSVTGCGASSSTAGQPSGPTLHVTLVKQPAQTLLDKEVDDAAAVRRLYKAALALPLVKPGVYNCGDAGAVYHLTFSDVQGAVRTMDANAGGCPFIVFPEVSETHHMDQAFIVLFKSTIGVSSFEPTYP